MDFFQASVMPPQTKPTETAERQPLDLSLSWLMPKPTTNKDESVPTPTTSSPISAIAPVQQPLPPVQQQQIDPQLLSAIQAQMAIAQFQQQRTSSNYDPQAWIDSYSLQRQSDRTMIYMTAILGGCFTLVCLTAMIINSLPNATVGKMIASQSEVNRELAKRQPTNFCVGFFIDCPDEQQQQPNVQQVGY